METIELNINKNMLDLKFEGYKLSLEPVDVLRQFIADEITPVELREENSYLHVQMSALHNHLFQDNWIQNNVFYVNGKNCIVWSSLHQDRCLAPSRIVWKIPTAKNELGTNVTLYFPSADWGVLCDGRDLVYILHTPRRGAGEPWISSHHHSLSGGSQYYIRHAVHRNTPDGHHMDCLIASIGSKSALDSIQEPGMKNFVVILQWISFTCGQNMQIWTQKRIRKLMGSFVPEYAAIDSCSDGICIVSESEYQLIFDSEKPIENFKSVESKEQCTPLYTFIQSSDDILVRFRLEDYIAQSDVEVNFFPSDIEIYLQKENVLRSQLTHLINTSSCTWILDDHKLEIRLAKAECGLMWQNLMKGCNRGQEIMEPALSEEMQSQLALLTSQNHVASNTKPFNLEQLEECDDSAEYLIFQRIDGDTHRETHRANLGGQQWLFAQDTRPGQLPALCVRHDVDGVLWQPRGRLHAEHVATFHALGYVQASKRDRKWTACSPDFRYAVIAECARRLYLYGQPEEPGLRHRRSGGVRVGRQFVVSLDQCDAILGLRVCSQCVFVLGRRALYAVPLP